MVWPTLSILLALRKSRLGKVRVITARTGVTMMGGFAGFVAPGT